MSALYPNSILLGFEKGYKAQVVNKKDIDSWDDLVEFVDLLEEHREDIGDDIQTIVFDTVDEAYPMAEPYMCKKEGKKDSKRYKDKRDIAFGQGWGLHDQYFRDQIKRIYNLGFSVLYLTHSQIKTIKPKNDEEYQVYQSTMPDRLANIVYPECDYIIHGERVRVDDGKGNKTMKRALVVKGNDESIAGNRVFFDEDIIFESEEEAMEKFQAKFKEGIQRNLDKAGIKTDIEELSKSQEEERKEKVSEYVDSNAKNNVDKNEEYIKEIRDNISNIDADKMKAIMQEYGISDFKNPEDIKTAGLKKIVELI